MKTIPSSPSHTLMISSLPDIALILTTSPNSLSDSEIAHLAKFGTLVAENMEKHQDDPITTLLSLITRHVAMASPEQNLPAALLAIYSLRLGDLGKSCSELSRQKARLTSLAISRKNTRTPKTTPTEQPPSQECH